MYISENSWQFPIINLNRSPIQIPNLKHFLYNTIYFQIVYLDTIAKNSAIEFVREVGNFMYNNLFQIEPS